MLHLLSKKQRTAKNHWKKKNGCRRDDIENVKKLREIYNGNDLQSKVLHEAEILEGSVRNTGIHASAIIIAPKDLTELFLLQLQKNLNYG